MKNTRRKKKGKVVHGLQVTHMTHASLQFCRIKKLGVLGIHCITTHPDEMLVHSYTWAERDNVQSHTLTTTLYTTVHIV